jgi:hypothetical protein
MAGSTRQSLKIPALHEIILRARLVEKLNALTPTGRHDFMHNKVLVIDDTVMLALQFPQRFNAENILLTACCAETYSAYIDHLKPNTNLIHRASNISFSINDK